MQGTPSETIQVCSQVANATFTTDSTTTNGTGFDAKDAAWVMVVGMVGAVGAGSTRFRIEESEDNSSFAAVTNATTGTITVASRTYRVLILAWAGKQKRYVRAVRLNSGFTGEAGCFLEVALSKPQNAADESAFVTSLV